MKLTNISIKNYKSIEESGEIKVHEKIHILAGKNNTGKSAFIEALYKVINGKVLFGLRDELKLLRVELDIRISNDELYELYDGVSPEYKVPNLNLFRIVYLYDKTLDTSVIKEVKTYVHNGFRPIYTNNSIGEGQGQLEYTMMNSNGINNTFVGNTPQFINNLTEFLKSTIVYISGSRYVPRVDDFSKQDTLLIEGANLNAFLFTLNNNFPSIFKEINKTFTIIFDDVISINTPITDNGKTFISISFEGMDTPISLFDCGSGYTHVLLFLCVLYTGKDRVVLFDEPQVFLHPSAEKAIYDLVNQIGENQYLFTTHSPILINYPFEKHLYHVSKEKGISKFTLLEQMQGILSDIGVSNSDYALSDRVLFVEGETEELVIPLILTHFGMKQIGYNYRVLNFKGTDKEFSKRTAMNKHKQKLDLILGGISQSPIPYKIIIDADDKTEEKLQELRNSYQDNIVILDRREYENYFLDSFQELAEIINDEIGEKTVEFEEVKKEIEEILALTDDKKLYPRKTEDLQKGVVGSEVLERLFAKYSLSYNKVRHGFRLTELILDRNPEKLQFFKDKLHDFINS